MRFKHTFKNYASLSGLVAVALLGVYGILMLTSNASGTQPKPLTVSSVTSCTAPDKSFCSTDQLIRGYVSAKDFSDILENQIAIPVSCANKAEAQQYCGGKQSDLIVQLFKVQKNGATELYTRNQYIDFFRTLLQGEKTYTFQNETESGPTIVQHYTGSSNEKNLTLYFLKQNTTWKLSYVAIGAAQ